jgi:hypothetical protein
LFRVRIVHGESFRTQLRTAQIDLFARPFFRRPACRIWKIE